MNATAAVSTVKMNNFCDVIFDSAGGSEVFPDIALTGGKVDEPAQPVKAGYTFDGWYTSADGGEEWNFESSTVTEDINLYAHWTKKPAASHTAHDSIEKVWGETNSLPNEPGHYYLTNDVYFTETWNVNSDITLCLNGQTISGETNLLINVDTNGKLTLYDCEGNGTLSGYVINHDFPMYNDEPVLLMAANSAAPEQTPSQPKLLTSTPSEPTYTQGVSVKGTFTLKGGTLTDFSAASNGGAVSVEGGTFIMEGGNITKSLTYFGGSVYVKDGIFTMGGGMISNCVATFGGGVYVNSGTFTMNGGKIANCIAAQGGGVCVDAGAKLMVSGNAEITGCTATSGGGGLYLSGSDLGGSKEGVPAECTMSGGKITGCIAEGSGSIEIGGGVYVDTGVTFTMEGTAEITDCHVHSLTTAEQMMVSGGIYADSETTLILRGSANVSGCSEVYYKYGELIEEIPNGIITSGNVDVYDTASIDYLECSLNSIKTNNAFSGSVNNISLSLVDGMNRVQSLTTTPLVVVDGGNADAVINNFKLVDSQAKVFKLKADGDKVYLVMATGTYTPDKFDVKITDASGKKTIEAVNGGNTKIMSSGGEAVSFFKKDASVCLSMNLLSYIISFQNIYIYVSGI